jgi:hypothetical protein
MEDRQPTIAYHAMPRRSVIVRVGSQSTQVSGGA